MLPTKSDLVLKNLTNPPKVGRNKLYRWCDYIELRCITHRDKRFSRDALAESIEENRDQGADEALDDTTGDSPADISLNDDFDTDDNDEIAKEKDRHEEHAAFCFKHLRWRATVFGEAWPFLLDAHAQELSIKKDLTAEQRLYISLLLSSSLAYIPKDRWRGITGLFELASKEIMKNLMPRGAEVHAFGAAETDRYKGHLYDRLVALADDINGQLTLKKRHFDPNDHGDSGLDVVAWHDLGDGRVGMPIAFAQCGCTANGWPDKMLQASPARLAGHLNTLHEWATYYFMPLDLTVSGETKMDWQYLSDFSRAIVIDRLRFLRLSASYKIPPLTITACNYVDEAMAINQT